MQQIKKGKRGRIFNNDNNSNNNNQELFMRKSCRIDRFRMKRLEIAYWHIGDRYQEAEQQGERGNRINFEEDFTKSKI